MLATSVLAAPSAVDDTVTTPSNTTILAEDLAANDTSLPSDVYTITVPPAHGTATLTTNGLLDYTPDIGYANADTLTYTIDDGAGGVDTATVNIEVELSSDFLTTSSSFVVGLEDVPTPLNISVDPSLEFGGTLQDIIGVDALYRASNDGVTPVSTTIPAGTTSINITGYGTRDVGTGNTDSRNDDYYVLTARIDLRNATYSGRLTYSVVPNISSMDQFSWLNMPLGQSVLSDASAISGNWTGAADPVISLVAGQLQITETIPLQVGYHVEFMTADGDSANINSASGAVQTPGQSQSSFAIPKELEPASPAKQGYIALTGLSANNGANPQEEHKGFSRLIIDLESRTVSGAIASERGETDGRVTTWAFTDYPLIDLQDAPAATPVSIQSSTATRIGDTSATVDGVNDDPTLYIDAAGDLIVVRAAGHAGEFTTITPANITNVPN